jgi:hypothetical protein
MFFLTFGVVVNLGVRRYSAIRRREVSIRYYRLYTEGQQPDRLQLLTRHAQNHFEVPPLFHIAVLFLYASHHATPLAVGLAWLYFLLRCLHSYIHLGTNNVSHRFAVYGMSGFVLAGLWLFLLVSLLR